MQIKNSFRLLTLSLFLAASFTACNNDSDKKADKPKDSVATGMDADTRPVKTIDSKMGTDSTKTDSTKMK